MTTRRSVSRVAAVWKYMAMPARNAAAQPAVAVSTAGPPAPPSSLAASAMAAGHDDDEHHRHDREQQQVDRVADVVGQEPADEDQGGHRGTARPSVISTMRSKRSSSTTKWLTISTLRPACASLGDEVPEPQVGVPVEPGVGLVEQQYLRDRPAAPDRG